jgi:peptidyl-prolyl cis-trans isomerase C
LQNAVKEELVRREILAQEAKKKGLDKSANIQGQIELAKQAVLIRAYLSDYVKAHPSATPSSSPSMN